MEETFVNGLFLGFWGVSVIFSFIWWILTIISNILLFSKAGYAGWKSIVPIYNFYIQQCITFGKEKGIFALLLIVPLVGQVYGVYLYYSYARAFGLSQVQAVLYIFFAPFFNVYMAFSDNVTYDGPRAFFID